MRTSTGRSRTFVLGDDDGELTYRPLHKRTPTRKIRQRNVCSLHKTRYATNAMARRGGD
jgi:hypothetical protein